VLEGHSFITFGFPESKPIEGMLGKCEVLGFTTPTGYATRYEQASSKGEKAPLTPVRTKGKKEKEKRKSITPGKKCPLSGKEG